LVFSTLCGYLHCVRNRIQSSPEEIPQQFWRYCRVLRHGSSHFCGIQVILLHPSPLFSSGWPQKIIFLFHSFVGRQGLGLCCLPSSFLRPLSQSLERIRSEHSILNSNKVDKETGEFLLFCLLAAFWFWVYLFERSTGCVFL